MTFNFSNNGKRILAYIPARSGSKGLTDKNIRLLSGKPLLAHTIEAAIDTEIFQTIFVSTDDQKYAEIAVQYGATVPFLRSLDLAQDNSSTWDALANDLIQFNKRGQVFDEVVILQPTSPLRHSRDIVEAYKLFCDQNADSVSSVCEVDHPVQWCFEISDNNKMDTFYQSPYRDIRRQDLAKHYRENGAIYILNVEQWLLNDRNFYTTNTFAYVMSKNSSIDIDEEFDFAMAEMLMKIHLKTD